MITFKGIYGFQQSKYAVLASVVVQIKSLDKHWIFAWLTHNVSHGN